MNERLERYWAGFFGLGPADLRAGGVRIVAHVALSDWSGIWLFFTGPSCIVSAPREWHGLLDERSAELTLDQVRQPDLLRDFFGERFDGVVGPAWHGHVEASAFRPAPAAGVRVLTPADAPDVEALRRACDPVDWEHGAADAEPAGQIGCWHAGELAALAALRPLASGASDPTVVTHPGHRGRGLATAVVSRVVEDALAAGRLVLYQTLESNTPAVALATRLGFRQCASHVAVRLAPA